MAEIAPDIDVISEENSASHSVRAGKRFFLVDPLGGTKEFLRRDGKGSFTVNVALVENGQLVFGIVFAPALNRMFTGIVGEGAVETTDGQTHVIKTRPQPKSLTAVASTSHRDADTHNWLAEKQITSTVFIGSSLNFLSCGSW